jgi:hypothetical protein
MDFLFRGASCNKTTLLIVAFIGLFKIKKSSRRKTTLFLNSKNKNLKNFRLKKWQDLHQPLNHVPLLCSHPGESAGAGRVGLAGAKYIFFIFYKRFAR